MTHSGLASFRSRIRTLTGTSVVRASSLRLLAIVVGVLSSVLLARLGGADVKGIASAFAAANALAYTFVAFDFPQQVLRAARERGDLGVVAGLMIRSWPYYALLGSVTTLGWWALGGGSEIWLLLGGLGYLLSAQIGVATNGVSGPATAAVGAVIQQAGMVVLTLAAHLTTGLDDDSARGVITGSYLAALPYFLWRLRRSSNGHLLDGERPPPRELLIFVQRGLRWQPTRVAQFLMLRLDTLVAYAALGASTTGVYSVGLSTAALAGLVPAQFAANTTYRATTGGKPALRRDLRGALLSGTVVSAGLAATGWFLIPLLYGEEFSDAYWVLLFTSPGVVAYGGLQVLTNQLRITGGPLLITVPSFVGVTLMSISMLATANPWGTKGIAASSSLGAGSALVCAYVMLRKRARIER